MTPASVARQLILALLALTLAVQPAAAQEPKRIALSFDDVPRSPGGFMTPDQRTIALIAGLHEAGVEQAAFFVTTGNLDTEFGKGGEARIRAYAARKQPLAGEMMDPAEVAHAAVYFLSDESRAVTGQLLKIDGGWSVVSVSPEADT